MLYWVIKNHPVEGIRAEISFSDRARSRVLGPEFRAKKLTIADLGRPSSSPGRLVLAGRGCTSVGTSRENKICDRRYLSKTQDFRSILFGHPGDAALLPGAARLLLLAHQGHTRGGLNPRKVWKDSLPRCPSSERMASFLVRNFWPATWRMGGPGRKANSAMLVLAAF